MGVYSSKEKVNEDIGPINQKPKVTFEQINMTFKVKHGTLEALKNIELDIQDGEFICFIGPSGCGKSTLLRIAAGLTKPTSGRVIANSDIISGPSSNRAMVFQDDAVFPWLTVRKNIEYGLKIAKVPKEERRKNVDHYLKLTGLDQVGGLFPRELSGGMRKRVDIARAFANNPEILLMDEPFGMLDAMTKEHLQQETMRIWESTKKTIMFVTHDLEEAIFLADRIVILESKPGKVHKIIPIDFERSRDIRIKTSVEFQEIRSNLLDILTSLSISDQ